jgi:hypothetical protein
MLTNILWFVAGIGVGVVCTIAYAMIENGAYEK